MQPASRSSLEPQLAFIGDAFQRFEDCASSLSQIETAFETMSTWDEKRLTIGALNEELAKLGRRFNYIQNAINNLPSPHRESFEESLGKCQGVLTGFQAKVASLKPGLNSPKWAKPSVRGRWPVQPPSTSSPLDRQAVQRAAEQNREGPNPPGMPTFKCPPGSFMQAGERPAEQSGGWPAQPPSTSSPLYMQAEQSGGWGPIFTWDGQPFVKAEQDSGHEVPEEDSSEKAREREEDDWLMCGPPEDTQQDSTDQEAREEEEEGSVQEVGQEVLGQNSGQDVGQELPEQKEEDQPLDTWTFCGQPGCNRGAIRSKRRVSKKLAKKQGHHPWKAAPPSISWKASGPRTSLTSSCEASTGR
jgi:hypothetical protein